MRNPSLHGCISSRDGKPGCPICRSEREKRKTRVILPMRKLRKFNDALKEDLKDPLELREFIKVALQEIKESHVRQHIEMEYCISLIEQLEETLSDE